MFRQGAVLVYIISNSEICLLLFRKGIDGDAERGELFARDGVVDLVRDTDDAGTKLRAVVGEIFGAHGLHRKAHIHDLRRMAV